MPRPKATSYRFGDDTLALINALAAHLSERLGIAVSASDAIRTAVRQLAAREGLLPPVKKSRKKSPSGIDSGNTSS